MWGFDNGRGRFLQIGRDFEARERPNEALSAFFGLSLTSTGWVTIKPGVSPDLFAVLGLSPFVLRDQRGATVWESVPSGKGGGL